MPGKSLELVGGALCLDFANTVSDYQAEARVDHLEGYGDLVAFAAQTQAIPAAAARRLRRLAGEDPAAAARALARARDLREALFWIFHAAAHGKPAAAADLEALTRARAVAAAHQRLEREGEGYALGWDTLDDLQAPLWPIAVSAVALVTSAERLRVRTCVTEETGGCTWLFVDTSRNGSRRWCSMRDCGNRAKARRHYARATARA